MVEYREASKLLSSFAKKLPAHINARTGRVHPEFLQCGTDTGRFSCHRPNLQQIPKEQAWRDLFVAPAGHKLITADYSQIELRILAEFSKDPNFIAAYRAGEDLHQRVADALKISRDASKAINFGIVYGMGPSGLAKRLGVKVEEAGRIIESYFIAYPKVKRTLEAMEAKPLTDGYTVTPLGRKRFFRDAQTMKEHGEMRRQARNTPIQAMCGDILKVAIRLLSENLREHGAQMVNLIHDEIIIECPDAHIDGAVPVIRDCMVKAGAEFIKAVPVEVNILVDTISPGRPNLS